MFAIGTIGGGKRHSGNWVSFDSVEIRWPSGAVEKLTDLPADHSYSVLEGPHVVNAGNIRPKKWPNSLVKIMPSLRQVP